MKDANEFMLSSITVEGFRAFSTPIQVGLPSRLVVIYGRNGRGKSTLFDAISWAFNGELRRYKQYGNEWRRSRKSHIRSLSMPAAESKVKVTFASMDTNKLVTIERTEHQVKFQDPVNEELMRWFTQGSDKERDVLWAHMLAQDDLHLIARAKGRERLQVLAPKLDLSASQSVIDNIDAEIKRVQDEREVLRKQLANVPLGDHERQIEVLEKLRNKVVSNFKIAGWPLDDSTRSRVSDLRAWRKWVGDWGERITSHVSELVSSEADIFARYSMANNFGDLGPDMNMGTVEQEYRAAQYRRQYLDTMIANTTDELKRSESDLEKIAHLSVLLSDAHRLSSETKSTLDILSRQLDAGQNSKVLNTINKRVDGLKHKLSLQRIELAKYETQQGVITRTFEELRDAESKRQSLQFSIKTNREWMKQHDSSSNLSSLRELENKLSKLVGEHEHTVRIKDEIYSARAALVPHVTGDSCPLCGHVHDSKEDLLGAIDDTTVRWNKRFNELRNDLNEVSDVVRSMRAENEEYQRRNFIVTQSAVELKTVIMLIDTLVERLLKLPIWTNEFGSFLQEPQWDTLEQILLQALKKQIDITVKDIEITEREQLDALQELRAYEGKSQEIQREIANLDAAIKQSEMRTLNYTSTIEEIYARYEQQSKSPSIGDALKTVEERIAKLRAELLDISSIHQTAVSDFTNSEYNWSKVVIRKKQLLEQCIDDLANMLQVINTIEESNIRLNDRIKIQDRINETTEQVKKLKMELKAARERQSVQITQTIGPLSSRVSHIYEFLADKSPWTRVRAEVTVPGEKESPNLIFRPMRSPKLEEQLQTNEAAEANTTFLFSSGQFSVLGLSIFLAQSTLHKNQRLNGGASLNSLLIDDPIQALDSVRDDALAHLLCDIARERQVVVTTSDINFANRLVLASRPIWELYSGSCGVLHLDTTIEGKNTINEVTPGDWIEMQGLFMPKSKKTVYP